MAKIDTSKSSVYLKKDLTIGSKTSGIIFGRILLVEINSKKNILVADVQSKKIRLFARSGKFIRTIGGIGRGPGEFTHIYWFALSHKDQPIVWDFTLRRIEIFNHDNYKPKKSIIIKQGIPQHNLSGVYPLNIQTNSFLFEFNPVFTNGKKPPKKTLFYHYKGERFNKNKPVLEVPRRDFGISYKGGQINIRISEFGRRPIVHVGPDNTIYYARNDQLKINEYSLNGLKIRSFKKKVKKIPIKSADIAPNYKLEHDNFPAFDWFVVDNHSRVWVAVNTESRKNYTVYIFTKKGKLVSKPLLPKSVELKTVKDDYAYGVKTDGQGLKSVVRYKIKGLR